MIDVNLMDINWLTVLAGAVIYMAVGGIWYGPIAGKAWMAEMGLTEEEIRESGNPTAAMVKSFVSAIVLSLGLVLLIGSLGVSNWQHGLSVGLGTAILIVGGATFPNYAFEDKSLRHFLIHLGSAIVAMMLMGAMIGAWH